MIKRIVEVFLILVIILIAIFIINFVLKSNIKEVNEVETSTRTPKLLSDNEINNIGGKLFTKEPPQRIENKALNKVIKNNFEAVSGVSLGSCFLKVDNKKLTLINCSDGLFKRGVERTILKNKEIINKLNNKGTFYVENKN